MVSHALLFSRFIVHLVLLLLSSVCYKIYSGVTAKSVFNSSELQDIPSYVSTLPHEVVLMEDFNLHMDSSSSDGRRLRGILESFDLYQYVDFPTHIHGHSLDLMICSPGCEVLSVSTCDLISDHSSVLTCRIPPNHSRTVPHTIKYRKLQTINIEAFKADIQNADLIRYPKNKPKKTGSTI